MRLYVHACVVRIYTLQVYMYSCAFLSYITDLCAYKSVAICLISTFAYTYVAFMTAWLFTWTCFYVGTRDRIGRYIDRM